MIKIKDNYILLELRELEKIVTTQIDPHIHIPRMKIPQRHKELDKYKSIFALREMGAHSAQVCQFLEQLGYDITNLARGMDAWSVHVDPDRPTAVLVLKAAFPGKNHSDAMLITGIDHFLVPDRTTRLNHSLDPRFSNFINTVTKRKKGI